MISHAHPPLLNQWRRQISRRRQHDENRRPLGALGYLTNGPVLDGLIEVEKLVLVVLYDEPTSSRHCSLRLSGFSGKPVPWGIRWGGPGNSKFFKDLRVQRLSTTNVYAEVDLEMKAKALANCEVEGKKPKKPSQPWRKDKGLMEFLKTL